MSGHVRDANIPGSEVFRLDRLVHVDWSIVLGEETISLEELNAIAELKVPLVRVRGKWIHLSEEEIQMVVRLLQQGFHEERSASSVLQLALCRGVEKGLPVDQIASSGTLQIVLDRLEGRKEFNELPPPDDLSATLRPYQVRGYSWLSYLSDLTQYRGLFGR